MRQKLTYTALVKTATLVCFLLAMPFCVSASDTTHIAFTSERDGNAEIYIMDINGKNLRNLTNHPASDFSPAFSPNGRWMAYVSKRDGNGEIYVMYLRTKVSRRLTNDPRSDWNPAWSPDGQWIAFASDRAGMFDIYKVDINGANLQRLTDEGNNHNPDWSPDGQWIVFSSVRARNHDIYVMNPDGEERETTDTSTAIGKWTYLVSGWKTDRLYDGTFGK